MGSRTSASPVVWVWGFVWLAALTVRLIHLWQIHDAPFYDLLIGDALSYDTWARQIAGGDWIGSQVFYQAPLYPYLLGVIYSVCGHSLTAVRIVQAVFGATACVLLAMGTSRLLGRRIGITAGLMLAIYPPAIFFDGLIQKSSLDGLLVCALIATVASLTRRQTTGRWLVAGAICGLTALSRENALVFAAALLVWILINAPRRFPAAAALLVGLAVVLGPVAIRNYAVGGELHLTTSQLGPNLYIGNNADAEGIYTPLLPGGGDPLVERRDAAAIASQAMGRRLTPAEVSSYWRKRVTDYITDQPGDWIALMGRKKLLLIGDTEIGDTDDQYFVADHSLVLDAPGWVWRWGTALPLAVIGVIVTCRSRRRLLPLYLLAGAFAASVVAFYVMARYRFPLAPFVMVFAAVGFTHLLRACARRRVTSQIIAAMVCAAVTAAVCAYQPIERSRFRAAAMSNIGAALMQSPDKQQQAQRYLKDAIALRRDYAKPHVHLGLLEKRRNNPRAAFDHYRQAVQIDPNYIDAHYNMAILLSEVGQIDQALAGYMKVIELAPYHANAHNNAGYLLEKQKQYEQAAKFYQGALKINPNHREALNNLGMLAAFLGHTNRGVKLLQRAVEIDPDYADAHYNLGLALLHADRRKEAIEHLRIAQRLLPGDQQIAAKLNEAMGSPSK